MPSLGLDPSLAVLCFAPLHSSINRFMLMMHLLLLATAATLITL